ncbi:vitamin B12 ABC transporter permease BtuC [Proteus hauseri]|uniref:Vitamin B12 ABC transporter permease BtuC n=1 Tax=Proteus cibi TaxID=2050966 RepID=A0ABU6EBY8_9GAMM|nr:MULTISPECIES: vitamin B12 ABC transporter permease BtuC [Proteus]MBG6030381.1 vitamin B12 ABC transporter permease BtuC [Proteus hauseri]MBS6208572.1 vitamin B12 ABC transporter permease BtuC [Proteus hauseri]MEB6856591.1 vitamin B12 ABC transporter permease BtuC [Proteus cibi]MEB7087416.1 vitamin B12 ABC transporter permease BtuC [Proteus cibi]
MNKEVNPLIKFTQRQRIGDRKKLFLMVLVLCFLFIFSLSVGEISLFPHQWLTEEAHLFVWQIRLPRILAVVTVGASLAIAGAIMQALFQNPLAEPGLLGVSSGAGVCVVLLIVLQIGLSPWLISSAAIFGALGITLLLMFFTRIKKLSNAQLLLIGVALGVMASAIMTWLVYFSSALDLRQLMYWLMGSFSGIDWRHQILFWALIPIVLILILQADVLNYLSLGSFRAKQLGIAVNQWRNWFILAVGLLIGLSVALAGAISFVGLVVPHLLRLCGLTHYKTLLPACALSGGGLLLLADLLSRLILNGAEVPIGVITATLGAPLFIWLLATKEMGRL